MTGEYIFMYAMLALLCYIAVDCLSGWYLSELALGVARRMKVALRGSQAAKTTTSRRELETSSFEAYTHCGGCGKLDYHPMREPDPASKVRRKLEEAYWGKTPVPTEEIVETMGKFSVRSVAIRLPNLPMDETCFDVIRTCSCGHEWGQR